MTPALTTLLEQLDLQQVAPDVFEAPSVDPGWGRVFGGQVLAQALTAATRTVPEDRAVHSLHAYFLLAGDPKVPVRCGVERTRDGGSFTSRRVRVQQGERTIFDLTASFHGAEQGMSHQDRPPELPPPEDLATERALLEANPAFQPEWVERLMSLRPVEIRPIDPPNALDPVKRPPQRAVWMRYPEGLPDDPGLHRALLAYATDFWLLTTALEPHGESWLGRRVQIASLDHAVWFHRPLRVDQWLLYTMSSPSAAGARGFTRGQIYTRQGELIASVAQEGLIRYRSR